MDLTLLTIILIPTLIIIAFLVWFKKDFQSKQKDNLKDVYTQSLNEVLLKINEITKNNLKDEKENIATDLKDKKEQIEKLIERIEENLKDRHKELIDSRTENMKYFSDIKRQIEEHQKVTKDLETSAKKLSGILSQNQLRGEWGEKILEDCLNSAGMEKGIHYLKQEIMATGVRPDVVILLPEKKTLSIDAKFPLSNILKMNECTDKDQALGFKRAFETDVKNRLREIQRREYISNEEGTLDFAIMFVPNEVIFSYINKEFPAIVEEAFNKKVIIASPFSIYAIARTIMQGYRNYYYEQNLKDVLTQITAFKDQFGKFREEFDKLGRSFDTAYKDYKQISETRVSGMNRVFNKIEESERKKIDEPKVKVLDNSDNNLF